MAFYMGHEYEPTPQRQYRVGDRVRHKTMRAAGEGVVRAVADDGYCRIEYKHYGLCADPATKIQPAFKVGDRVRMNKHSGLSACGDRGTVRMVADNNNVSVRMDESSIFGTFIAVFPADDLDWVRDDDLPKQATAPAGSPCIVTLSKDGQPFPAGRPYIHLNVEAAIKEAERLARARPGDEFAVYQRVAARVAEQHIEMKEVA